MCWFLHARERAADLDIGATGQVETAQETVAGAAAAFTYAYITNSSLVDTVTWAGAHPFQRDLDYEPGRTLPMLIFIFLPTTEDRLLEWLYWRGSGSSTSSHGG